MTEILSLPHAERLAERTLVAISADDNRHTPWLSTQVRAYLRERVASDLAGLRDCYRDIRPREFDLYMAEHARRYSDNLRRAAALYGVVE